MRLWIALILFWHHSISIAAGIVEHPGCLKNAKTFHLENSETRIQAFQLLQGHKVVLESKQDHEGLSIECMMDSRHIKPTESKWNIQRQNSRSLWEVFRPSAQDTPIQSKGSLDITASDEFPVRTHIHVSQDGTEIRLRDSLSSPERSIQIKCGSSGLSVAVLDKSGQFREVFRNDFQMDMSIPPVRDLKESVKDYEARIYPSCSDKEYSIEMKTGTIAEISKPLGKENSRSSSQKKGTQ